MNLVIIHHHLNPGGVTRVIQNHLISLVATSADSLPARVVLLHGGRADSWAPSNFGESLPFELLCCPVEGLDYNESTAPVDNSLGKAIQQTLSQKGCGTEETLLHWHNHSLGKNAATLPAVRYLALEGYRTLLQIHDFAEDFRPSNYSKLSAAIANGNPEALPADLYPQATHIHYAALNRRDLGLLECAGVSTERLHLLPNPVSVPAKLEDPSQSRARVFQALNLSPHHQLFTYPVRGIRRKNLGELLLWSTLVEESIFQLTLAPESPSELHAFDAWKTFSSELALPCRLGVDNPDSIPFPQLVAASDSLVTTSVAEGFGMVFLEAWLFGKKLLGRDLPEISRDFAVEGLDLDDLYQQFHVPTSWIDAQEYSAAIKPTMDDVYSEFGLPLFPESKLLGQIEQVLSHRTLDFAQLPTALQREVIRRAQADGSAREQLLNENPKLRRGESSDRDIVSRNANVVKENYSPKTIGQRLLDVYATVLNCHPASTISPLAQGQTILESFLRFDRLHPVRVET